MTPDKTACKHCRIRVACQRGLCRDCHAKPDIAFLYPLFDKTPVGSLPERPDGCRHCRVRKAVRPRGLCTLHYDDPAIRALYPRKFECASYDKRQETMEDVERLVAEQRKCLPSWWDSAAPKGGTMDPDEE